MLKRFKGSLRSILRSPAEAGRRTGAFRASGFALASYAGQAGARAMFRGELHADLEISIGGLPLLANERFIDAVEFAVYKDNQILSREMTNMDEWGRDPSVQAMRKVFKAMEKSLAKILKRLDISPYDGRIRGWLEETRVKFERAWSLAHQMGIPMDEEMAPAVYARCLAIVINSEGIEIPQDLLPQQKAAERLIDAVCR